MHLDAACKLDQDWCEHKERSYPVEYKPENQE